MSITITQIESSLHNFLSYMKLPGIVPNEVSFLYLIILLALGLALVFRGKTVWKIVFAIVGAYMGAVFAISIMNSIGYTKLPEPIIALIGALIGALLLLYMVRFSITLGFAYIAYLISEYLFLHNFLVSVIVAIIVFVIAYIYYNKIIIILAGILGATLLWFAFIRLGASYSEAFLIAVILFAAGTYLQFREK